MFYQDDPCSIMPPTKRIPVVLMQNYINKGHFLYTDIFYTSPILAKFFLSQKTHQSDQLPSWNNCSKARKKWRCCYKIPIQQGQSKWERESCFYAISLSPATDGSSECFRERWHASKVDYSYNSIHCPYGCCWDQQSHSLQVLRKSYKWYRKLAFRLITQMVLNSQKVV